LNLLSAPEGIIAFKEKFPRLRIVTAFVDEGLDQRKCDIRSGLCLTLDLLFLDVATLGIDSSERIESEFQRKAHERGHLVLPDAFYSFHIG